MMNRLQPDVVQLGVDPVYRMLRAEAPFDRLDRDRYAERESLQKIRMVGIWAFQFHTYLELVNSVHGPVLRDEVQNVIILSLNQHADVGSQLRRFLKLTRKAVAIHDRDRSRVAGEISISVADYLAIMLLLKVPDSPFFIGRLGADTGADAGPRYEVLQDLSRSFTRGAQRVRRFYRSRLDGIGIDDSKWPCLWPGRLKRKLSSRIH